MRRTELNIPRLVTQSPAIVCCALLVAMVLYGLAGALLAHEIALTGSASQAIA